MYLSLQLCRALAALMVVCVHVSRNLQRDNYLGSAADGVESLFFFGDAGVAFFFVLSGFIVTWVHLRDFNQPRRLGPYLFKRVVRIYPSYWILFGLTYAAACVSPSLRDTVPHDAAILAKALLLIPQDPLVVGGQGAPVLFVAWSLQYEMLFYLAMALALVRQWLLLVPALLFLLYQWLPGDGYLHAFLANPRISLFMLGVLVAYVARTPWTVKRPGILVLAAGLAFATLAVLEMLLRPAGERTASALAYGAISALGVLGLIRLEDAGAGPSRNHALVRWGVRLGDASYVLYLLHAPVMSVLCKLARWLSDHWFAFGPVAASVATLLIVLACCAAALLFHAALEKPLLRWLNGLVRAPSPRGYSAA